MRYIAEGPFVNHQGKPITLQGDVNGTSEHATIGWVLNMLMSNVSGYQPVLNIPEYRIFNKVMDTLEQGPDDEGFYSFEDEHFKLLEKICLQLAPKLIFRHSPSVEDLLTQAPTHKSTPVTQEMDIKHG